MASSVWVAVEFDCWVVQRGLKSQIMTFAGGTVQHNADVGVSHEDMIVIKAPDDHKMPSWVFNLHDKWDWHSLERCRYDTKPRTPHTIFQRELLSSQLKPLEHRRTIWRINDHVDLPVHD